MQEALVIIVTLAVVFVTGVVLSQRVKDWFAGVPAHVRADLSAVEASVLGRIKAAQSAVLAELKGKIVLPTPVLQTSVTAAVTGPAA